MRKRKHPGMFFQTALGRSVEHAPGEVLAGCTVIRKAANATKNTRWLCAASCGHEDIFVGTNLRRANKAGETLKCVTCSRRRKSRAA